MHAQDAREAEQRRAAAAFRMRHARSRYKKDRTAGAARVSLRAWARKTYSPGACTGKLFQVVGRKERW